MDIYVQPAKFWKNCFTDFFQNLVLKELKTRYDVQNHTALAFKSTFTSFVPNFMPGFTELLLQ